MIISGNYNTAARETEIVKKIFTANGISFITAEKHADADAGDVLVTLGSGKKILIEVKEEIYTRFSKYGDLGIDFISAFSFNQGVDIDAWKGKPKSPRLYDDFIADIDKTNMKPGKVFYSKSDLWLFFVENSAGLYYHCFLDGKKVVSEKFREYLRKNCFFAVNNKPRWQNSYFDRHQSAVFFINHKDKEITDRTVDIKEYAEKL